MCKTKSEKIKIKSDNIAIINIMLKCRCILCVCGYCAFVTHCIYVQCVLHPHDGCTCYIYIYKFFDECVRTAKQQQAQVGDCAILK